MEQHKENIKSRLTIDVDIPVCISVLSELDIVEQQILAIIYYKAVMPPNIFAEHGYRNALYSKMWLSMGLGITSDRINTSLARLKKLRLLRSPTVRNTLNSLTINEKELSRKWHKHIGLTSEKEASFNPKSINQRIILMFKVSWAILTNK